MALDEDKIITKNWKDYELLDFGSGKKLERFGDVITIRPEVQAHGKTNMSRESWVKMAHAEFVQTKENKGNWDVIKAIPETWNIHCPLHSIEIQLLLKLTQFKHLGVFPEQRSNWKFIEESISKFSSESPKVLNLFAYTGGASLAAKSTGAQSTHVDSIKQVNNWGKINMEISQLKDVRWIVEDALKFAQKEGRRGNKYHGIIMDPPSWGRGPKGERWKIEDLIEDLINSTSKIVEDEFFLVLNTYSGLESKTLESMILKGFGLVREEVDLFSGGLYLETSKGRRFRTGTLNRLLKLKK